MPSGHSSKADKPVSGRVDDLAKAAAAVAPSAQSAPPASFSHGPLTLYGAQVWTTLDHTAAKVTLPEGHSKDFASTPGEEPNAFQQATEAAKAAFKRREADEQAERKAKRHKLIQEAQERNRGNG